MQLLTNGDIIRVSQKESRKGGAKNLSKLTIAERLVKARGKRTQREVAEKLGIGVSTIAMYETGQRVPKDEIKVKLSKLYGVPIQELFY